MNDERPIEKLLRRYAKKRDDEAGPPPELHPATRRLLHGEVARQFPKPAPESKPSAIDFLTLLTRRWIYAVGVFAVLCITAAVLWPSLSKSNKSAMLAQKESEKIAVRESLAPAVAPALAPATPPAEVQPTLAVADGERKNQPLPEPSGGGNYYRLRDESAAVASRFADAKQDTDTLRKLEQTKTVSLGMSLDSAAPKPGTVTVQPPIRADGETVATDALALNRPSKAAPVDAAAATGRLSESRQTAAAPAAAAVVSATPSPGPQAKAFFARGGGVEKDTGQLYSQSFANVAPEQIRAKAAKVTAETPVTPVLASFQLQNVGNELRVIDSDGSTYVGQITTNLSQYGTPAREAATLNFENADARRTQALAGAVTANQPAAQNYLWRVEGTNRTLNQNVVFTWNFVEMSNAIAASEVKAISGALNQDLSKLPSQFPMMLQNSIINGRAQFGPGREIEVNAVPVKP